VLTFVTQFLPRSPRGSLRKRESARFRSEATQRARRFGFVGDFYIQPFFTLAGWQAACIILLHVAWPIVPSKSASDHLFTTISEPELS